MKKILAIALMAITSVAFAQTQVGGADSPYYYGAGYIGVGTTENAAGAIFNTNDKFFRILGGYYGDTKSATLDMEGGHGDNYDIKGFRLKSTRLVSQGDGATFEILSTQQVNSGFTKEHKLAFAIDAVSNNIGMGIGAGNHSLTIHREGPDKSASLLLSGGKWGDQNSAFIDMQGGFGDNNYYHGFRILTERTSQYSDGATFEILPLLRKQGATVTHDRENPAFFIDAKSGNIGMGTRMVRDYKLSVEGTIAAREIVVNTKVWYDHVFEDDYNLRTLNEVESYINKNGHLPEIPTTKEVMSNGVALGEINAKLLQKIEELTLYMIDMKKNNSKLEQRILELESN